MKKEKYFDFTVDFPIKVTKRDAISKASMRKVFDFLFKQNHKESYTAFVKDDSGTEYCFGFSKNPEKNVMGWYNRDFTLDCCLTEGEGNLDREVMTTYEVDWLTGQHREVDHEYADYDVSMD